jgi:hypothetical protein
MRLQSVADLDRQFADARNDRLERRDEGQDDLAAGGHLELIGSPFGADA